MKYTVMWAQNSCNSYELMNKIQLFCAHMTNYWNSAHFGYFMRIISGACDHIQSNLSKILWSVIQQLSLIQFELEMRNKHDTICTSTEAKLLGPQLLDSDFSRSVNLLHVLCLMSCKLPNTNNIKTGIMEFHLIEQNLERT